MRENLFGFFFFLQITFSMIKEENLVCDATIIISALASCHLSCQIFVYTKMIAIEITLDLAKGSEDPPQIRLSAIFCGG